jgi:CBS domain-containing protein
MQTGAISYRVADFLKQHPPFQTMEEDDLLALVEHGRVKFHESDEYVYWQDGAHGPFVFVIEQGTVSLWQTVDGGERLRDIRGAGDILGIDRFLGAETSRYSAKTCSDVVIYALSAADFGPLVVKYPHAGRYLATHAAIAADYQHLDRRPAAHETFVSQIVELRPPVMCEEGESIAGAIDKMYTAGVQAIALPGKVVTSDDIFFALSNETKLDHPVQYLSKGYRCTVGPDATVSQCVIAMGEARTEAVAVLQDEQLVGVITAADLAPAFRDSPIGILDSIRRARDTTVLRRLNLRARAFLLDQLVAASSVDWVSRFASLVDTAILNRVLTLTQSSRENTWCFYGAAGRGELMPPAALSLSIAVIGTDDPQPMAAALSECGYVLPNETHRGTVSEWKERFSGWIRDPVRNDLYRARPLFDLRRLAAGWYPEENWDELQTEVTRAIKANKNFIPILANDCLSSLPPLTFFRDLVVEESGEETAVFQLERCALQPLVDVGRVFGLAAGHGLGGSSLERFAQARTLMPDRQSIFREASDALRIVLYHQAREGIRQGTSGSELSPASLSRYDRQVLKSCFRSIVHLLEFTAECEWLETR